MARLHREAREEERDQPSRKGRPFPGVRGRGVRRAPGSGVRRQGERGGHDQDEPREHEDGHDGDRGSFQQGADPDDGRDVADRAPEPDVDVPRRAFPEPAEGQRLELGQHPLPEEAEHEEGREEGPESGRPRDGRERGERPDRRDAHHPPAQSGPVGGVSPQPRGEELGDRQGREERPYGPRVEPPVEQVRREVRQERPGRREVREVPGPEPPLAAPRAGLLPGRGHRWIPKAVSSFTFRGGPVARTQGHRIGTEYVVGAARNRPPDTTSDLQAGSSGRLRRSAPGNRILPTAARPSRHIGNPQCDCPGSGPSSRVGWFSYHSESEAPLGSAGRGAAPDHDGRETRTGPRRISSGAEPARGGGEARARRAARAGAGGRSRGAGFRPPPSRRTAPPPAPARCGSRTPACPAGSRACGGRAAPAGGDGRARSRAGSSRW